MPLAFVYHEDCALHENGPDHPERPERIRAIRDHLKKVGLLDRLLLIEPELCPLDLIEAVHPRPYIESIREACRRGPVRLDPDTGVVLASWRAALLSAGGAIAACDAVVAGRASTAFVCTRPPGHHAEPQRAMGFCLFNNVAIAARYLQTRHRLARIAIVDWDVHHGNGTQNMFEADDTVFYFSAHQFPYYPGSGARTERGRGRGAGFTLNAPLPAGSGDKTYLRVFSEELAPALDAFRPDALLISAGFDAHERDPLAGMALTDSGYAGLTAILKEAAAKHCGGRIISLLEGGYDLQALGSSVEAHLRGLGA
ncbi:MAG TPA: histone deacetylase [Candidatus Polarisedimenticolia bacterium]